MIEKVIETDVLCVGGGIAGLMAAIKASELGAKVVVVDKGNVKASGLGRSGNDHFSCYLPEVHGPDIEFFLNKERLHRGVVRGDKANRAWAETSSEIVKLWESWGIPMKTNGQYEFAGHGYPGSTLTALKYSGKNQKIVLTNEALKKGVQIVNRVMVFDLLSNDGIFGAIGVGTRENKIMIFNAKSVILGTGCITRLYPSMVRGWINNPCRPITLTGDGRAMAFRAGAELVGLDMLYKHCGPKYFARSGQATWVGVIRNAEDKPVGPFVTKPDKRYGDPVLEFYPTLFEDYFKSGKGPLYMDCRGISDEDYDHMIHFMKNEGFDSLLKYLEEEGIDLRKNPVEFMRYETRVNGGIYHNEKAETSLKGLYAAGEEWFTGISNAASFGWIAGENATKYAREATLPNQEGFKDIIQGKKEIVNKILARESGADWKDANIALEQIMNDYAGSIRSGTMLSAGLSQIRRLKSRASQSIMAKNSWELTRCLETLNLIDLGELVLIAANERKETRGGHVRPDYPFTDPQLDRSQLYVKRVNGQIVTEWRKMKD